MWFARFGDTLVDDEVFIISAFIELYFCFSMYTNFVTDYLPEG